jgi:hypothetical protein
MSNETLREILDICQHSDFHGYAAALGRIECIAQTALTHHQAESEPLCYLKFRAALLSPDDGVEWLEQCSPGDIGDDGLPAFPVFSDPQPAAQVPEGWREALEFYAEPTRWTHGDVPGHVYALEDSGAYARNALTATPSIAEKREGYDEEIAARLHRPKCWDIDAMAQEIRRVNGDNQMGAGALAEHLCTWLAAAPQPPEAEL